VVYKSKRVGSKGWTHLELSPGPFTGYGKWQVVVEVSGMSGSIYLAAPDVCIDSEYTTELR
jgi:hypothetical protein